MKKIVATEVKEEILSKVKAGETVSSLAKLYGVSDKAIYNWVGGKTTNKVSYLEFAKLRNENKQLKEIIGVLSLEVEKSKKKTVVGKIIEEKILGIKKSLISKVLHISKRNLYYQNTKQTTKDEVLKDQILKILESNPAYGYRRIAMALKYGKKRVRRVMRLNHIKPLKRKARWSKKRDFGNPDSGFPNLIKGSCPIKPNVVFAGDFTYLRWNNRFIYLATFFRFIY